MEILETKLLTASQFSQIDALWNREYPLKLKDRFSLLLNDAEDHRHYVIEDLQKKVLAWAVDFKIAGEIRFSIIVDADQKEKGLGSLLINRLKARHSEFYGWVIDHNNDLKINGEYYLSPMPFYLKHGFTVLTGIRLETEMIRAVKIKWNSTSGDRI
jgi:GNAT superfamily N-acetyltransferase